MFIERHTRQEVINLIKQVKYVCVTADFSTVPIRVVKKDIIDVLNTQFHYSDTFMTIIKKDYLFISKDNKNV